MFRNRKAIGISAKEGVPRGNGTCPPASRGRARRGASHYLPCARVCKFFLTSAGGYGIVAIGGSGAIVP